MYTINRYIEDANKGGDPEIIPSNVVCFNREELNRLTSKLMDQDFELYSTRYKHDDTVMVTGWVECGEKLLTVKNYAGTINITIRYREQDLKTLED